MTRLSFALGFMILFIFVGQNYSQLNQAIVRDDSYVVAYNPSDSFWSGFLWVQQNDQNYGGYIVPSQPQHTYLSLSSLLTCPYPCWISVGPSSSYPGYTGYESFNYHYEYLGDVSSSANVDYLFIYADGSENAGSMCPFTPSRGKPVNVANGNVWLRQDDYSLLGGGNPIEVSRTYNSSIQTAGLFGIGWTTAFDESLIVYSNQMVRWNRSDGRAVYFGRPNTSSPFKLFSKVSSDQSVALTANNDGTYSIKYKTGDASLYSSTGKLLSFKDRNNNTTTLTYDVNGHLNKATDAFGREVLFTTNANGTVSQITDGYGTVASYEYQPSSSILKDVTFPDGSKYKFSYQTVGSKVVLTTVKDALDNILEKHEYDTLARGVTSESDNGVEKYTFNYGGLPFSSTVTDANGNVTTYAVETGFGVEKPVSHITGSGCCGSGGSVNTVFDYDNDLNVLKKTDGNGHLISYTYDANRNKLTETDSLGTQKWTYNSFGEVLTYRDRVDSADSDPSANTVTNTYDSSGNLLTTKDRLGNVTTYTYNSFGQPLTVKDALNHTTTLTWDSQGRLTKVKDADNKETTFGYDARARVTSITNAKSETTGFEYDLNNRLKKITYPDASYKTFTYDLAGRRTGVTDELEHSTTFAYDAAYRMISVTDALNHTTAYGYDLMSNLTSITDALGNVTNYEYDAFDRLKKIKYPEASSGATRLEENFTYDSVGNIKTRVDTASRTTAYDYDNLDRLTKITDALNGQTQFEYDARSNLTKVKDAANQEYIYIHTTLWAAFSANQALVRHAHSSTTRPGIERNVPITWDARQVTHTMYLIA